MKYRISFLCFLFFYSILCWAQTTKSVGTGGDYADLQLAFNAINTGAITGNIVLQIISNVYQSSAVPILYHSGYGGVSNYSSVTIYPTGSGYSIYCANIFTANGVIRLDGADNVTIDGRVNQTGSTPDLTIYNPSTTPSNHNLSTLLFINGATNNTVKYCNLQGSSLAFEIGPYDGGLIYFAGSSGTSGNSNNTIEYCNITSYSGNRVVNVIYSYGASSYWNSNNTIRYNNIYDVLYKGSTNYTTVYGIYLSDYNTGWTITGNSFYETSSMALNNSNGYQLIRIASASNYGNDFTVTNNYIGGSAANCSGTWTKTNYNSPFYGIYLHVGNTTASNIQGNTIKGISWTNNYGSTIYDWHAIYVANGLVNVGTTSGNTIGASTGTGSISFTSNVDNSNCYGIKTAGGTVDIQNNIIGAITTSNSNNNLKTNIYGIYNAASATNISNNEIGSTSTANSLYASSYNYNGGQFVCGIGQNANTTVNISNNTIANLTNNATPSNNSSPRINGIYISSGNNTITGNTIYNLTINAYNQNSDINMPLIGICLNYTTAASQNISGNTIYNLNNNKDSYNDIKTVGIYYNGSTTSGKIDRNFIHSFTKVSSVNINSPFYGIWLAAGNVTVSNNIIFFGSDQSNIRYGIYDAGASGQITRLYHNTVYISGSQNSSYAFSSYCVFNAANNGSKDYRNNVLFNTRSNSTSGSGKHYAIYLSGTTNLTINFNNYLANGTYQGVLGYLSSDRTTLANWQSATSQDANSLSTNPSFANAGGTNASDYDPSTTMACLNIGIYSDYNNSLRGSSATMGAFEDNPVTNAVDVFVNSSYVTTYANLKAAFNKINDGTHQGNITLKIKNDCVETETATLNASGSGSASYTAINIYPTASGYSIMGEINNPLIDLNGADNVTIDGRVNASGTTANLQINNSSAGNTTGNSAIRFNAGATSNTVQYCYIKSASLSTAGGIICFGSSGGNSNNTISKNYITNSNGYRPINVVYSLGSLSNINASNSITNNYIYDFLNASNTSYGIYCSSYTSTWTISGNSFYETATFTTLANADYTVIYINDQSTGNGFIISGNYIGGSSANCSGTLTKTGSFGNEFKGMYINVATSSATKINGNQVSNISWTVGTAAANFIAIHLVNGLVEIGNTSGNIIGSATGTGSITFTSGYSSSPYFRGIYVNSGSTSYSIQNNTIAGITTNHSSTYPNNFYGIYMEGGNSATVTISNNTIGSTSTANSIQAASVSTSHAQVVYGIYNNNNGTKTISNNTIANLTNSTTNTNGTHYGTVCGIYSNNSANTVENNIIRNLTIANNNGNTNYPYSAMGILLATTTVNNVSDNTIYEIANTYSSFGGHICGIYFAGSTSSANTVLKNFIHSINASGSGTHYVTGIRIQSGLVNTSNNIIKLGSNNQNYMIYGILDNTSSTSNIYFNTVHIGGSPSGSNYSYALYCNASSTKNYRCNIFNNARSSASGNHYGAYFMNTTSLTLDYNNYYASGTGGYIGYSSGNKSSLPIVTGQDANSLILNPIFINSGGVNANNYVATTVLNGTSISGFNTDYSGATRSAIPQMGAFEYYYTWTGSADNNWNNASNWNPGIPPSNARIKYQSDASNHSVLDQNRTLSLVDFTGSTKKFILGNNDLTVSTIIGATADAYVQTNGTGVLKINISNGQSMNFPVGNTAYNPVQISNNSGSADVFSVRVLDELYKNGVSGDVVGIPHIKRTWDIGKVNINSGSGVNLKFYWNSGEIEGTINTYRVHHYGTKWEPVLCNTECGSNNLTITGYTGSFSPFGIAEDNNGLPVELLNFYYECTDDSVEFQWATASELNNWYFSVEKSTDMIHWQEVARIPGKGTSNAIQYYTTQIAIDDNISTCLFRLKQVDYNKETTVYDAVSILDCFDNKTEKAIIVFPNPVESYICIENAEPGAKVNVFDSNGKLICITTIDSQGKSTIYYNLPKGLYMIQIMGSTLQSVKVIKP